MRNDKDKKLFYNQTSMDMGFIPYKTEVYLSVIQKFVLHNPEKLDVLDIGCYDGRFADIVFEKFGLKIDGIDISDEALKQAKNLRNKLNLNVDTTDKLNLPLKYDVICAGDVIEHLYNTDMFIVNCNRLLKKNGILCISTPNIASLGRRLLLFMGKNPFIEVSSHMEVNSHNGPVVGHLRYFTLETLKKMIAYHGFEVVGVYGMFSLPFLGYSKLLSKLFPQLGFHITVVARKINNL